MVTRTHDLNISHILATAKHTDTPIKKSIYTTFYCLIFPQGITVMMHPDDITRKKLPSPHFTSYKMVILLAPKHYAPKRSAEYLFISVYDMSWQIVNVRM